MLQLQLNMKSILVYFVLCTCSSLSLVAQDTLEYQTHMKSIDKAYFYEDTVYMGDDIVTGNINRLFVDYTIKHLITNPNDKYFISNRRKLRKLKTISCDSTGIFIKDKLSDGKRCEVKMEVQPFDSLKHEIVKRWIDKENYSISSIDGEYPYGGEYAFPDFEITKLSIKINGLEVYVPYSAYQNLFDVNVCNFDSFERPVEVYESLNGKYIYVYIYGGVNASTYYAKLVFNRERYITRIIADYYALSIHHSFWPNFFGY